MFSLQNRPLRLLSRRPSRPQRRIVALCLADLCRLSLRRLVQRTGSRIHPVVGGATDLRQWR